MSKLIPIHLHTEFSLLDGMIKVDDLVKKTLEFNQIARSNLLRAIPVIFSLSNRSLS